MKIRLMGVPEELTKFQKEIKNIPGIDIIYMTQPYANRGMSKEQRIYIECKLNTIYTPVEVVSENRLYVEELMIGE